MLCNYFIYSIHSQLNYSDGVLVRGSILSPWHKIFLMKNGFLPYKERIAVFVDGGDLSSANCKRG